MHPIHMVIIGLWSRAYSGLTCNKVPSDQEIVRGVEGYLHSTAQECADGSRGVVLVETAGGVHSPTPTGSSQADAYRPLRLPLMLVADAKLGGISATISAFESLHLRGYDLDSVLVFREETYQNYGYLRDYFAKREIQTVALEPPPPRLGDVKEDREQMSDYYSAASRSGAVQELLHGSEQRAHQRIERLLEMPHKAYEKIWYPFTQHKDISPSTILAIDSAHGDYFQTVASPSSQPSTPSTSTSSPKKSSSTEEEKNAASSSTRTFTSHTIEPDRLSLQPTIDGSASWWTQGLGHSNPELALAAAHAAGRYGHVMFAGAIHEPALKLSEMLLEKLQNPRLAKVFFSDDGSTGMEVAVKMALTASSKRYGWDVKGEGEKPVEILGLKGSYHGDTIGAMDLSEGSTYNEKVHWYEGRGHWFDFPLVKMKKRQWVVEVPSCIGAETGGEYRFDSLDAIFDNSRDGSDLKMLYESYLTREVTRLVKEEGRRFGALVMEPVILGAGGMLFADPLFQRTLVNVVRSQPSLFPSSSNERASSSTTAAPDSDSGSGNAGNLAWSGLPVVCDEVFTGMYRLGFISPSVSMLHIHADIVVHAKLLTGGLLPLCTTTASNSIYEAFLGDEKADALLHGHSYTAHAVGCGVAVESLRILERTGPLAGPLAGEEEEEGGNRWGFETSWMESTDPDALDKGVSARPWSLFHPSFVTQLSHLPEVESVIALGSVLAISLCDPAGGSGYTSTAAVGLRDKLLETDPETGRNVHCRVLGNVLYLMMGVTTERETVRWVEGRLREVMGNGL